MCIFKCFYYYETIEELSKYNQINVTFIRISQTTSLTVLFCQSKHTKLYFHNVQRSLQINDFD